jgi:DNA-binding Xre family transcriptional regulator
MYEKIRRCEMYKKIRERMLELDVNQSWIARRLNITRQAVSSIMLRLKSKEDVEFSSIEKICKVLNLKIKLEVENDE